MADLLDPIRRALDARIGGVEVFFRDDDAGWADERLLRLLDVLAQEACPIDLAIIPAALSDTLAATLRARRREGERIGLHQHGYRHTNHEPAGRPCEFGPSRTREHGIEDVALGRARLLECFSDAMDPIFTPPWNRCDSSMGTVLTALGFRAISRDGSAVPLNVACLHEWPISVDWFAKSKGRRLESAEWSEMAAQRLASSSRPVGVMFHHAQMDDSELAACGRFVSLLVGHRNVRVMPMRELGGTS